MVQSALGRSGGAGAVNGGGAAFLAGFSCGHLMSGSLLKPLVRLTFLYCCGLCGDVSATGVLSLPSAMTI